MASARVTFNPKKDHHINVVGHGTIRSDGSGNGFVASLEAAGPARALELEAALRRFARYNEIEAYGDEVRVALSLVAARHFDEDFAPVEQVGLALAGGELLVVVHMILDTPSDLDAIEPLLAPFFGRHGARLASVHDDPYDDPHHMVEVGVAWPLARRTVADLFAFGNDVLALLEAADGGAEIEQSAAIDLLDAGRWDLFRGQPESGWLEAKGKPYDFRDPRAEYELAKDVAAFANSPGGGLIVLGLTTTDTGDGDTVTGHKLIRLASIRRQRCRNVIARRVYPAVRGFEVRRIADAEKSGYGLAVLVIPSQREDATPFLVTGIVDDKGVLGAHILLSVRREDDTAHLDAASIHARLRLGEQMLAGR
ncbi:MAG TPA: RNA-binding domain-containing protein [Baekduia sp.]